ncbi:hypothetical protein GCM10029992_52080 [Glycomyces albus]
MLEGGDDAALLEAGDVGGADRSGQIGVLTDGLLGAAPAGVGDHVEDRGESLVDADLAHARPDAAGHLPHQVGVEGGAPGERRGEDRRAVGHETGQALLVDQGRDAEPVRCPDTPLQGGEAGGALDRVDGGRAERARELAEPVLDGLGVGGLSDLLALVGRHVPGVVVDVAPQADQLRAFLFQRHLLDQSGRALGRHCGVSVSMPLQLKGPGFATWGLSGPIVSETSLIGFDAGGHTIALITRDF